MGAQNFDLINRPDPSTAEFSRAATLVELLRSAIRDFAGKATPTPSNLVASSELGSEQSFAPEPMKFRSLK
jgi:hypothetical protein